MFLGLKLWSINTDYYYVEAERLYKIGLFDFIELYVVPGTTGTISKWAGLDIPFALHAPHFVHGVNLADFRKEKGNMLAFEEVGTFAAELSPLYVVVHGGTMGSIQETARQMQKIKIDKLLIENKPYYAPLDTNNICRGASVEEVDFVIKETGCGFCLDVGHALCSANSQGFEPYQYLGRFNQLKPQCYHLSDGVICSDIDKHLHLGEGSYDFKHILDIIDDSLPITLETEKCCPTRLDDFVPDVEFLNGL